MVAKILPEHDVKNLSLSKKGKLKIAWARRNMPVLQLINKRFKKEKPLKGIRLSACLHVTSETACLMEVLKEGGADLCLCASNPLSTQDSVAASIVNDLGISVFAIKGEDKKTYYKHINAALDHHPNITMDDGADLVSQLHKSSKRKSQIKEVIGSSEETTTGVIRLRAMERDGALKIPVIAVNDTNTKHLFDNRYGIGQSTIDGILRATNVMLAGRNFVVCGFGWGGRGLSSRAAGMGANVIVTEVDPIKALEAMMEGYRVMPLKQAAKIGDIFVTVTGNKHVIDKKHFKLMKDGAIVANTGHFNVEFNIPALENLAIKKRQIRKYVDEYELKDGKKIYALAEGRLVNLVVAEGHPAAVMDMSFANQALAAEFFVRNKGKLEPKVYGIPPKLDREVARLKLESMGVKIDKLTREQKKYLESWEEGT